MSIVSSGFGSCGSVISLYGWGACPCIEYIPSIIAEFLSSSKAYSCIVTRDYVQLKDRSTNQILLRVRPSSLPDRIVEQLIARSDNIADSAKVRSAGWPRESSQLCEDT